MALHIVYEAVVETTDDPGIVHATLSAAVGQHGTSVELLWQSNNTQEDGE